MRAHNQLYVLKIRDSPSLTTPKSFEQEECQSWLTSEQLSQISMDEHHQPVKQTM